MVKYNVTVFWQFRFGDLWTVAVRLG